MKPYPIITSIFIWCVSAACILFTDVQKMPIVLTPLVGLTVTPTLPIVIPTYTIQSPQQKTYIIKEGDTLSEIALRLNLSVEDLLLANEGLDARIISKGATLMIPLKENGKVILPTPTALPLQVTVPFCFPNALDGFWCIALVRNDSADPIDEVSGLMLLYNQASEKLAEQHVVLPLSRLSAGKSLPLLAYFPSLPETGWMPNVQILSALTARNGDGRFLPLNIQVDNVTKLPTEKAAQVQGRLFLAPESNLTAGYARVVVVAYDAHGNAVGMKAWDWQGQLTSAEALPFDITVFSLSSPIANVEVQAEASEKITRLR